MDKVYKIHINSFTCSCLYETQDIDMSTHSSNAQGTIRCKGCGHSWAVSVQDQGKLNMRFNNGNASLIVEENNSGENTLAVLSENKDKPN